MPPKVSWARPAPSKEDSTRESSPLALALCPP